MACESPTTLPVLACPQGWGSPPLWEAVQLHGVRTDLSNGTTNSEIQGPEGLPRAEPPFTPPPPRPSPVRLTASARLQTADL